MYEDILLHAINDTFTQREIDALLHADVPLYGPHSIREYIGQRSIEWFVRLYFPDEFYLEFAPIHRDMLADLQEIRDRQVAGRPGVKLARAIPRGHAKSTFYSRILPLHGLLYGWSKLTVLLGNNDDAAKRLLSNIRREIETNERIQEDFPYIKGKYWGNERIESNDGNAIVSFGIGSGSIRGVSNPYRPALIIGDDIDDDRSVRSSVELAANKEWFDKSVLHLGDNVEFTTSFVMIGTIIRKTSLLQYVLNHPDFNSVIEQGVKQFATNTQLWDEWSSRIIELARHNNAPRDPTEDTYYQENKEKMLAGVSMLWDRPNAYYYAMTGKLRNDKAFWSEIQNQPKDTTGALGDIRFITDFDESEYDLLAVFDPTTSGKKDADYAAWVEILFSPTKKHAIVAYADVAKRTYAESIDTIATRIANRGRRYQGIYVETNSAGTIIKDLLTERLRKERLPVTINGIHHSIPKAERIAVISEYTSRGQLQFSTALPEVAMNQVYNYPFEHDDFPDAVGSLLMHLQNMGLLDLNLPDPPSVYL